jgi:hypothetical protein
MILMTCAINLCSDVTSSESEPPTIRVRMSNFGLCTGLVSLERHTALSSGFNRLFKAKFRKRLQDVDLWWRELLDVVSCTLLCTDLKLHISGAETLSDTLSASTRILVGNNTRKPQRLLATRAAAVDVTRNSNSHCPDAWGGTKVGNRHQSTPA